MLRICSLYFGSHFSEPKFNNQVNFSIRHNFCYRLKIFNNNNTITNNLNSQAGLKMQNIPLHEKMIDSNPGRERAMRFHWFEQSVLLCELLIQLIVCSYVIIQNKVSPGSFFKASIWLHQPYFQFCTQQIIMTAISRGRDQPHESMQLFTPS